MKQPIMFRKLLNHWTTAHKLLAAGIEKSCVAREPKEDWAPLKGLSPISDLRPPEAYAIAGWAEVHNELVMRFRRLAAFSAFWSGISKADLEARLETYAMLMAALGPPQASEDTTPPSRVTGVDGRST